MFANSPAIKSGKRLITISGSAFLFTVFVVAPIWVFVLVPLAIVSFVVTLPRRYIVGSKAWKLNTKPLPRIDEITPSDERPYDLILYGATGFTGGLAAKYIATQYGGSSFKWAIAGRRLSGLKRVRDSLVEIDSSLADLPLVIADNNQPSTVRDMVNQTRTIISTVGPFVKYGSSLVGLCARLGTNYCDITGEVAWVTQMIDLYDDDARASGARIVSLCGHDSVPWDLMVLHLQNMLGDEPLDNVNIGDRAKSSASGGTLATIIHMITEAMPYRSRSGLNPLYKHAPTPVYKTHIPFTFVKYVPDFRRWCGFFIMAALNGQVVRWSNARNQYSPSLTYSELLVFENFRSAVTVTIGFFAGITALTIPPLRWALFASGLLPLPGQGQTDKQMEHGFLEVTGIGHGQSGTTVSSRFYFDVCAGYKDTARMLVESALCFVLNDDDELRTSEGGIYSPAVCQGEVLLHRLEDTGTLVEDNVHME